MNCQEAASLLKKNIEQIMVGSEQSCGLIMMSLLAGGHILLEDVPGTGKTTLALSLIHIFFHRLNNLGVGIPLPIIIFNRNPFHNQLILPSRHIGHKIHGDSIV